MLNKLVLPTCPYCGARVWYVDAFLVKNKALYTCPTCKGKAAVLIKSRAFKILWVVQIISVIVFSVAVMLGGGFSVLGFVLINILFAGFYAATPYMVSLKFARIKREKKDALFEQKEDKRKTCREDTDTDIYSN